MYWYDDLIKHFSDNYTLDIPVYYPGVGFLETATKQPISQPENEPFIKLFVSTGGTNNAVLYTGAVNNKRQGFTLAVEIMLPITIAGSSATLYTPASLIPVEEHLDSFLLLQKIPANNDAFINIAQDRPKFTINSTARSGDYFTSTVIQYNYFYNYCG